jgi:hypothetical protein
MAKFSPPAYCPASRGGQFWHAHTPKADATWRAATLGARSASIMAQSHLKMQAQWLQNQEKSTGRDKSASVPRAVLIAIQVPHEGLSLCVHECALDPPKPLAPPETHSKRPNPDAAPRRRGASLTRRPADAAPCRRGGPPTRRPADAAARRRGAPCLAAAARGRRRRPEAGGTAGPRKGPLHRLGPYVPHWP